MTCRHVLLLAALLAACGGSSGGGPPPGPPFGLTQRVPVTGLTFPSTQPQPGSTRIVNAFPNLTFTNPIFLTAAPGDTTRVYVALKEGRVLVLDNTPAATTTQVFLDIRTKVRDSGERGFLGFAFHPDFATNGFFYVYYSAPATAPNTDHKSVIARYTATSATSADPASELVLLEVDQPYSNHNAGMLAFGPDGMLYVALGDGGSGGDPLEAGQSLTTLLGKILRLTPAGGIPADNPFVGQGGGVRGEIWAYGLRNPWRFSFDRNTGDLWCGDVGQNRIEEIDLIVKGGNYGWNSFEGNDVYDTGDTLDINDTERPVITYTHSLGASVTGGYVYRGTQVPALNGVYVYGDFISGRVWGLVWDGTQVLSNTQIGTVSNPASFGEDGDGELHICAFDGRIYKFEQQGGGGGPFPQTLSDTGLFTDTANLVPAPGLIEYEVNAQLWSDGAAKRRWIALPGTARILFDATGNWAFPPDTVIVKHFELETAPGAFRRLETRVLVLEETGWQGYTYKWNGAQTDADLLAGADTETYTVQDPLAPGGQRDQTWYFPSRTDCLQCHTVAAGRILGVRTGQLNRDFDYANATDNQLRSWNHVNLFTVDIGDPVLHVAFPDPYDTTAPDTQRARGYLEANCAICHRPGGPTPVTLDLRFGIASGQMNAVDVPPSSGDLGLVNARIVAPGSKESSTLWERLRRLDGTRMPPLASSLVDRDAVDVIGRWIDTGAD